MKFLKRGLSFLLALMLCAQAGLAAASAGVQLSDAGILRLRDALEHDPNIEDLQLTDNVLTYTMSGEIPVRIEENCTQQGDVELYIQEGEVTNLVVLDTENGGFTINGCSAEVVLPETATAVLPDSPELMPESSDTIWVFFDQSKPVVKGLYEIRYYTAAALVLLVLDLIPNFPTSIAEEIIDYAWENSIPSKCLYVLRFTFHDRYFSGGWRFEDNFYMDEAYGQYVTTYEWEQWTG